jgi:glycosyltransferase involved in cell wall biosynthesis
VGRAAAAAVTASAIGARWIGDSATNLVTELGTAAGTGARLRNVSGPPLRVGLIGGVPPSLAGGGLELQVQRTAAALARRGAEVIWLAREERPRAFDVLHAFSSGPDVAHQVGHWRRNADVPLVVSPVMVVPQGAAEWRQLLAHRLPIPEFGPRQRRALLARAAAAVALTRYEAELLRRLCGRRAPAIAVVGNGVDPVRVVDPPPGLPDPFVLLLGSVSARKRQHATVEALAGGPPPVVIGGFEGPEADRTAFAAAVERDGGTWLGEVHDEAEVRAVVRAASALVHLSTAEGQSLAVLEALAEGTPVAAAPLPANRELAERYPGWVGIVEHERDLPAVLDRLRDAPATAPAVDSWDDVAAQLAGVYRDAGARPGAPG